ncbi:hypothetical protein EVAR_64778_1 [Eumeta japonica]|uniref:Uncharacterized protein n=1 Tax=Eumeta variegata TaxID=151549 RepID=A0A4C1ZLP0_EUMVA|nr:hypothetical protein EVAR_64778_1 [Eumeta japonica]
MGTHKQQISPWEDVFIPLSIRFHARERSTINAGVELAQQIFGAWEDSRDIARVFVITQKAAGDVRKTRKNPPEAAEEASIERLDIRVTELQAYCAVAMATGLAPEACNFQLVYYCFTAPTYINGRARPLKTTWKPF